MATGSQADIVARLQRWLPAGWFPTDTGTRIYAVLSGFASALAVIWNAIAYVRTQTRIATATDGFLDLASWDFFGRRLPRNTGELDGAFSGRIRREVFRDRDTRNAIDALLFEITGAHPTILELERPADTGCYRNHFAYGAAGCYGSRAWRFAVLIRTKHALPVGLPNVGGWRTYLGGFRTNRFVWLDSSMFTGAGYTDAQMMAALNAIRMAGAIYLVSFL